MKDKKEPDKLQHDDLNDLKLYIKRNKTQNKVLKKIIEQSNSSTNKK